MPKGVWLTRYYCPKCYKSLFLLDSQAVDYPTCPHCGNDSSVYRTSDGWVTAPISVESEKAEITIQYTF